MTTLRRILRVRGTVQGVGFRPFVFRTARDLDLRGSVWNEPEGVVIDAEGEEEALDALAWRIRNAPPPAARVENLSSTGAPPVGFLEFVIRGSEERPGSLARVSPDRALCEACRMELADPSDRRFRYPFINCTDCGPRYSIARDVPYDRARTTMARFTMCEPCRREYHDPASRRFHAQPNACASCGPTIWIHGRPGEDAIEVFSAAIRRGEIAAIKGLGGFHLACDARNEAAVRRLRERKRRPDKPFAVMFPALAAIEEEASLGPKEREALSGARSPILLLPAREPSRLAPSVAPRLREIGAFLPYTPLHHRILSSFGGPLVMTSGNASEEPIASDNGEALRRLAGIADLFLMHDRDIHMRADDSVVRILRGSEQVLRRSRGFVPEAIDLGEVAEGPAILAVGADLKNVLCVTSGRAAILSQHIGDLESFQAQRLFGEVRENLQRLFQVRPELVAHDLHPGYHSTAIARGLGLPTVAVQHHHAHIASCLADNERRDRVIGVSWDGTGFGDDGSIWGGEFLLADLGGFERVARLRPVPLPGGDRAAREPWRMAVSHLMASDLGTERVRDSRRASIEAMIRNEVATVATSSAGRLFDAVSSLLGICDVNSYEGQAAMELEAASAANVEAPYPFATLEGSLLELDLRETFRAMAADLDRGTGREEMGGRFHLTLAVAIAEIVELIRTRSGLGIVALSGGCFQSRLLTALTVERLEERGFEVLLHRRVPPNDGGIALGQAVVAAFTSRKFS